MKKIIFPWVVLALVLTLALTQAQAEVVGRLSQVEGRVDLLKGGNLPATPIQTGATVEPKDVIRTKSLSKAQITFIDNSVLTISPESRIAIEEFMVDPPQGKRRAVLEIFQGLALVVVNKIFKVAEPDYVIKTHTAIMGVRGTEFGIRIQPNGSTIMNFEGLLQVGNIFPEVSQLFLKAFKLAYAFEKGPGGAQNSVFLKKMQGTYVGRDLPPTLPFTITREDQKAFQQQLNVRPVTGNPGSERGNTTSGSVSGYAADPNAQQGTETPIGTSPLAPLFQTTYNDTLAYTPPTVLPANQPVTPILTPPTYNFSLFSSGPFVQGAAGTSGPITLTSSGFGFLRGDWSKVTSLYTATDVSNFTPSSGTFPSGRVLGYYTSNLVGTVSPDASTTMTGSATLNFSYTSLRYTLTNSAIVQVSIDQSGQLTYTYTGTDGKFHSSAISGTSTGSGTAHPTFASTGDAVSTATLAATASPAAPTVSNQLMGAETPTQASNTIASLTAAGSTLSLAGETGARPTLTQVSRSHLNRSRPGIPGGRLIRTQPMVGLHRGSGLGPAMAKINLTPTCGLPIMPISRNIPGKVSAAIGRASAGPPGGDKIGVVQPALPRGVPAASAGR